MEPMLKSLLCIAGAGLFGLPLDSLAAPPGLPPLTAYEPLRFPDSLRLTSVADGYALMMFTIRPEGEVDDAVAIEASHPAFVDVVKDGLSKWRFEAAAAPRRELIQFDFRRTGMVASLSQRDASKSFFPDPAQSEPVIRTVEWDEMQQQPKRTVSVLPAYPRGASAESSRGFAVVNCIIDSTGAVRVPVVTEASDPRFGEAALKAVRQWRFVPPTQEGRAVNVRMTRSFNFGGKNASR